MATPFVPKLMFNVHVLSIICKSCPVGCKSCPVGDKSCPVGDKSCRRVKVLRARNSWDWPTQTYILIQDRSNPYLHTYSGSIKPILTYLFRTDQTHTYILIQDSWPTRTYILIFRYLFPSSFRYLFPYIFRYLFPYIFRYIRSQGLSSPQPGDKIKLLGIHQLSPARPPSPVRPRIWCHQPQGGTPQPHAPGVRMT